MKKVICLLLALLLTVSCMAGVCFAAEPIALVSHGTQDIPAYTAAEIKDLITPDGTTVVKMLKDHVEPYTSFLYGVYTFTLDLNGFTAGSSEASAVGVQKLGSKNTTTVVKNGTLVGGRRLNNCIRVDVGGFRLENVVAYTYSGNATVGVYQSDPKWNDDILITGCTILGQEAAAVGFTNSSTPQSEISFKIENTTLLNSRLGGNWGTYPIYERDVPGGTVVLGKNVHIYTNDRINWIDPDLKHTGETITYQGKDAAFNIPSLVWTFNNLHHWSTPDGGLTNPTSKAVANSAVPVTVPTAPAPAQAVAAFADVPTSFWGFDAIDTAYGAGLVKGKSTTADGKMNYAPNDTMTRAEFLTTIMRFFYADEAAKVSQDGAKWWQGYYDLAVSKGVLKAAELDNGDLDKAMTREEMALVLHRTAPSMKGFADAKKCSVTAIPDYKTVTNVYKDAVLWVYGAGLIQGMDAKGTFAPQNSLTRAQSASILSKLVETENFYVEHLIPEQNVADTTENRQKAVIDYAWAYFYKNPYIQYDVTHLCKAGGRAYGDRTAARMNATPEMSGPHRTTFAHCQFYGYCVIYQAFGHEMTGSWETCTTTPVVGRYPEVLPYEVFYYETNGNTEDTKAAMEEMFAIAQPGDILSYTRTNTTTPHVVIYTGDLNGDGIDDMLHVGGTDFDKNINMNIREPQGAVMFNTWRVPSITGIYDFFMDLDKSYDPYTKLKQVTLTRYTDEKHAQTDPLTDHAKSRLLFPKMDISYTVDRSIFGSAVKGEELTYTLSIKNNSTQDHKGIEVNFPVPKNAKVVKIDGREAKNGIVSWTLDIPAGQTVTHTYTVRATGKVGSVIDTGVGYVHAIPMPVYTTSIVSKKEDAQKAEAAIEANKNKTGEDFLAGYLSSMNLSLSVPTLTELKKALYTETKLEGLLCLQPKARTAVASQYAALADAQIPCFFGGQDVATECESLRVKELRAQDLMAGDILIWQESADAKARVAVHNGEALVFTEDGEIVSLRMRDLDKFTRYSFFIALRPTQAQ